MIPKFQKFINKHQKDFTKPAHWIEVPREEPPSREDVIKAERSGVKKAIDTRLDYSRAARSLKIIETEPNRTETNNRDQEIPSRRIDKKGRNLSTLQQFFEEANEKILKQ